MAERANAASFEYLDTVADVEKFTSEIADDARDRARYGRGELPPLRRSRLSAAALHPRPPRGRSIPCRSECRPGSARCSRIRRSRWCSTTPTTTCGCCSRTTAGTSGHIFDTRVAAQLLGYTAFGLAALLERFFDVKLDKKHQRADWSMRPLTDGHARLRGAGHALSCCSSRTTWRPSWSAWAAARGRARSSRCSKARAGRTRSLARRTSRMKGARDLSRRELAVLRELVPWRDAVAGALDRATFRVLGNEQLLEIARTQPRTKDALGKIKGMPRAHPRAARRRPARRRPSRARRARSRAAEVPARRAMGPRSGVRRAGQRPEDGARRCRQASRARSRRPLLARSPRGRRAPEPLERRGDRGGAELRRWQVGELGADFVRALEPHRKKEGGRYVVRTRLEQRPSRSDAYRRQCLTAPCTPAPSARCDPATRRASTRD